MTKAEGRWKGNAAWRRVRLRRLALALAVSWTALASAAAQAADPVTVTAAANGEAREISFAWPAAVSGTAKLDGRTLTITFDRAFSTDIGDVADKLGGVARLVRQSADQTGITAALAPGFDVYSRSAGPVVTVFVVPSGAKAPADAQKLSAAPTQVAAEGAPPPEALAADAGPLDPHTADAGVSAPELTISEADGYSRLTFRHPAPVLYDAALSEAKLTIRFKTAEPTTITRLRVDPPVMVRMAESAADGDWFTITMQLAPGTGVRHFQEGATTVVDLVPPAAPPPAPVAEHAEPHGDAPKDADAHGPPADETPAAGLAYADIPDPSAAAAQGADAEHGEEHAAGDAHSGDDGHGAAPPESSHAPDGPAPLAELPALGTIRPRVAYGADGITVTFPVGLAVPAAIARRGDRIWIAFAGHGSVDMEPFISLGDDGVRSVDPVPNTGATILGLMVEPHILATAVSTADGWQLKLGNAILTPPPTIAIDRIANDEGGEVVAHVEGEAAIAQFTDPEIGDDLVLVMTGAPVQGLITPRELTDFEFLPTAQGLVIRPLTDGLTVTAEPDRVVVRRSGGLRLSGSNVAALVKAELPENVGASPAFLDFDAWKGEPGAVFRDEHDRLLHLVAEAQDAARPAAEMEIARFLLAYGLAEEALGVLRVAVSDAPQIESDPAFRMTRAAANLRTRRFKEAEKDLNSKDLPNDAHVTLWRGYLAAAESRWPEARLMLDEAERAIGAYNDEWQTRFRFAAARASLAVNDLGAATAQMNLVPPNQADPYLRAENVLLKARLAEASGDTEAASAYFKDLSTSTIEPLAAEAELNRVRMELRAGTIQAVDAIDALEALRFRWRGDATEVETLIALGELYVRIGDYRHGLSTLRIAVANYPGTPQQRRASQTMADIFEDLYLNGAADELPPIQALGLYYDFKELTPVGSRGDLMIRRLADRLVAMDLLDQATELLDHQVANRLRGVARAQVAVKLAMVELLNNKPEDALRTIQTTRQARLPETVAAQRRLIEARALFEVGRHQHALDTISADAGPPVERLRADIHWGADDWPSAAASYLNLLAGAPAQDEPLSDQQRLDVMRSAIAYTLAGDTSGRDALRERFAAAMATTSDARSFDIITAQNQSRSVEFRTLVERIAAVDTLSSFMEDLKRQGAGDTEIIN